MESSLPETLSFQGNVSENFKRFEQNSEICMQAAGHNLKPHKTRVAIVLSIIGEEEVEL